MEPSKSIFASKTLWLNLIILILTFFQNQTGIPPEYTLYIGGILNIINRFMTNKSLHIA